MNTEKEPKKQMPRLSDQDKIHQALELTETRRWVALVCIAALLTALIIWSFVGRIPTKAVGRSVSLSPEGVFLVRSKSSGIVTDIFVKEGDMVQEGQDVIQIDHPGISALLVSIKGEKYKIATLQVDLGMLEHAYAINKELFEEGLVAKIVLDQSKTKVLEKQIQIEESRTRLSNLYAELVEKAPTYGKEEIHALIKSDVNDDLSLEKALSTISSPHKGRVLEVLVTEGIPVEKKEPLIWMEHPFEKGQHEYFYGAVNADVVGRIQTGMRTQIEPTTVNPQEYGSIIGTVKEVYPFPVSRVELLQDIGNTQIVDYLLGDAKAVSYVLIDPVVDESTPSGFKWTSAKGPPYSIPTGTIATIKIVVEEQPPISFLIPLWRIQP